MAATIDEMERSAVLLRALVARGFQFIHPRDSNGGVVAVHGVRAHDDVVDIIELHAEHDARAMRMSANEKNVRQPTTTLWETSGPAFTVLTQLLDLLDHEATNGHGGTQSR